MKKIYVFVILLCCIAISSFAQVTTSNIKGSVTDDQNQPLPGANIIAVHTPTGTRYGGTTNLDGRYNLLNMRVGGPYTVTISYVGFKNQEFKDIQLFQGRSISLSGEDVGYYITYNILVPFRYPLPDVSVTYMDVDTGIMTSTLYLWNDSAAGTECFAIPTNDVYIRIVYSDVIGTYTHIITLSIYTTIQTMTDKWYTDSFQLRVSNHTTVFDYDGNSYNIVVFVVKSGPLRKRDLWILRFGCIQPFEVCEYVYTHEVIPGTGGNYIPVRIASNMMSFGTFEQATIPNPVPYTYFSITLLYEKDHVYEGNTDDEAFPITTYPIPKTIKTGFSPTSYIIILVILCAILVAILVSKHMILKRKIPEYSNYHQLVDT